MKVRLIPREEIDKVKWNSCVHYATNGNIFGYMWYLDAMSRDWSGLVEGDYESVMPLPNKQIRWGKQGLVQPPLIRELAIYSVNPPNNKRNEAFWAAIPEEYRHTDLYVDAFSQPFSEGYEISEKINHYLPLTEAYELLRERFSQAMIDQLEVAKAANLFPVSNLKPERIADLHRQANRQLSDVAYHGLQRIMYNILHRGWGFASGVMNDKQEVLAAEFFIFSHGRIMSLAPSQSKAGTEVNALAHLYDTMLRQQAGKPQLMDFNTSLAPGKNTALQNTLQQLVRGFGALHYDYFSVKTPSKGWLSFLA